jgi:TolB-like protein/Flp pilus assembly protein TadD
MPGQQRGLTQFWQELKRRKVVRVITVYAAAAFVMLELVDIITEPFGLPDWTMILVVVLLTIGFIISVILSWIYDIHPEGGIVRTEPAHKVKSEDIPVSTNSWRIATYGSMVVIVGLIMLNVFSNRGGIRINESLDKSIAVLPFQNDSRSAENEHVINGYMASVHDNLCRIKDLKVLSLLSTEQYRNNLKPIPEIAQELKVGYLLSARGQMYDKKIRLIVQLTDADENIIWSHPFDKQINEVDDHISIQSEIAQSVAAEIEAIITPEEKQLIEKIPTTSLTALDFYQRGNNEYNRFLFEDDNSSLERAEAYYLKALEYDSTFAQAYTGLALTDYSKHYSEEQYAGYLSDTYLEGEFLDSILILADIALSYDDQLSEAYTVKGYYYHARGLTEQANKEFDQAIRLNPNDWMAYSGKGQLYGMWDDNLNAIVNLQKAASLNHGSELPGLLVDMGWAYLCAGFSEKNNYYIQEALKLDDDSAAYYFSLAGSERWLGNFEKGIEFGEKAYAIDSNHISNLIILGANYMYLGQYEESLKYYKEWFEELKALGIRSINDMSRIGYVYWLNGYKEEANYYFNEQINFCNRSIELGRLYAKQLWAYYDLAGVYAFRGEKDKAFENLRFFNQKQRMGRWLVTHFKHDPLFDSIRNEPEFQQIVSEVEAKYQAEHERVGKWLEENDMLQLIQ